MADPSVIRTPDQRLRVFVSSTLAELAAERRAIREAIEALHLVPVMFELGARPHPPRELYRSYLEQSHVFVGLYWQRYGWVAPGEEVSGLEDEYRLAGDRPRLIYVKEPAPDREEHLADLLADVQADDLASYAHVSSPEELARMVRADLAVLLTERFEAAAHAPTDVRGTTPRSAVPAPLTATIGRDREVAAVTMLFADGARLVTLTGVGGIGKTRVAEEVATAWATDVPGAGAHVVPLAAVTDEDDVLPTVAASLGVRVMGRQSALEALVDHFGSGQRLLVLDNLEQVVGVAPRVLGILRRCPGVRVLATSRQALRVEGEHEVPLAPLAQPDVGDTSDEALQAPAVRLLVERARAVRPDFSLSPDSVRDVTAVCALLDGLPLAIELAAARLRMLSPVQLRDRLARSIDVLVGGQDRPARHRTLRATLDWSHDLLDDHEQVLFARLGVFAGGCTLDAAEQVCAEPDTPPVLDTIAGLVDKSLVVVDDTSGSTRLRMLETVRAYAAERLEARGEQPALRDRHLAWMAELTDRAQPFLCGPSQLTWAARMDPERPNLRAAIAHAMAKERPDLVVDMAWDVYVYYFLRGAPGEAAAWMHAVSPERGRLDAAHAATLDTTLAIDDITHGDFGRARRRLESALPVFEAHALVLEQAVAHMHLGLIELGDGTTSTAVAAESTATELYASIGHDWGAASSEAFRGLMYWLDGDTTRAREHYERSLGFAERIQNEQLTGQALVGLAATALEVDDVPAAAAAPVPTPRTSSGRRATSTRSAAWTSWSPQRAEAWAIT